MLPDDALDRLISGSKKIGDLCKKKNVQQWEIIALQSYGHELDIEAGKISLAAGGGGTRPADGVGSPGALRITSSRLSRIASSTKRAGPSLSASSASGTTARYAG